MSWDPFQWWSDFSTGNTAGQAKDLVSNPVADAAAWLTGIGGSIASGIEAAMVAVLGDIWDVIAGPIMAIGGIIIMLFFIIWAFKNQIIQAAVAAAAVAK